MLRTLITNCSRSITLLSPRITYKHFPAKFDFFHQKRFFAYQATTLRNVEADHATSSGISENDLEYIVPYKADYEKPDPKKKVIQTLSTKFYLTKEEIHNILSNEVVLKTSREKSLLEILDLLCYEGLSKEVFIEFPWVITLEKKKLVETLSLIKSINGLRHIHDFVPFFCLSLSKLRKLVSTLNREASNFDQGNRVYFIAESLKVTPTTVTKYLAKRLFVLEMPLEMFKKNLENMINYNVEPMNILKDLWGFRYAPKSVEMRLKRASQAKKDRIMPWMVRCPEPILQKSLQLSLDELEVLGEKTSVAEYIGERLGFSPEEAQVIMNIHPQVNTVRVTKIKEVLDYLLDEAKFTRHEIAQVPRILCHSLETTKERIEELKKFNCRPTSLVIVCRSKKEYEKFLKQWQEKYKSNYRNTNDKR